MADAHLRWPGFNVGDVVTRNGSDRERVLWTNGSAKYEPDAIEVECIREPVCFVREDGVREPPWIRLGEKELNLAGRYTYVGIEIEGTATAETFLQSPTDDSHHNFPSDPRDRVKRLK